MKRSFSKADRRGGTGWDRLRQRGGRATLPRQAIRAVLDQANGGLRPEEIHVRAAHLCPGIGLVTVYRTLALFAELGWVRRVHSTEDCHAYVWTEHPPRHALVCRTCHRTFELPGVQEFVEVIRRLERQTGFRVGEQLLELHGTCPECQHTNPAE